jgi:hypothetical protein
MGMYFILERKYSFYLMTMLAEIKAIITNQIQPTQKAARC